MFVEHIQDGDVRNVRIFLEHDDGSELADEVFQVVEVGVEGAIEECAELDILVGAHDISLAIAVADVPRGHRRLSDVEALARGVRRTGTGRADDHENIQE